jgi:hypothetical protein
MTVIAPDVWRQIELSRPSGDELVGRQAAPDVTRRLLAAIDFRGRRHFLVALEANEAEFRDASSRGLTVITEELVLTGQANARYINLVCEDALGHAMFDLIGGEIGNRLHIVGEEPADVVSRVLAKWRRFWGQLPRQMLSREAQVGLFSELWFLTYWLLPAAGPAPAARMWRGPYGARHDFERAGLSIEAKGTTSTRGRVHKVNGLQQLDPPQTGRLLFFSLRLREEAGASNTLPMLVQACRERISVDPDAEGMLESGLIAAGYMASHEEEYSKVHWRGVEELLFDARQGFPRINPESFQGGVPPGIEEIEYTINLNTFDELVVATKPGDSLALLVGSG